MKLILLEDDFLLNKLLTKILKKNNYLVESFTDAVELNNYLLHYKNNIDFFILDLNVQNGSGIDVLKTINDLNLERECYKIMISGYFDKDNLKDCYVNGCDDYLKKPFNHEELLLKLKYFKKDEVTLSNGLSYNLLSKELKRNSNIINLTLKETLLIDELFNSIPHVVSHNQIEDYIYEGQSVSSEVVRTLIRRLRKKVGKDVILNKVNFGYYISNDLVVNLNQLF